MARLQFNATALDPALFDLPREKSHQLSPSRVAASHRIAKDIVSIMPGDKSSRLCDGQFTDIFPGILNYQSYILK